MCFSFLGLLLYPPLADPKPGQCEQGYDARKHHRDNSYTDFRGPVWDRGRKGSSASVGCWVAPEATGVGSPIDRVRP